jgi:D-glycero-alpha-D-manno-heptose 1-phosphate guanylyltransferase
LRRSLLTDFPLTKFSLEKDFMEKKLTELKMVAFPSSGYFIDIGIPEDYALARKKFG